MNPTKQTKPKTLESLIKKNQNFDWVSEYAYEFPFEKPREGESKLFAFDKSVTSEEAISRMREEGYEPMTATELIEYASGIKDKEHIIVALGTTWRGPDGHLDVLVFRWLGSKRHLSCYWFGHTWLRRYCRFAGRRPRKLSLNLNPSESTLTLESLSSRVEELEAWKARVQDQLLD